MNTDLHALTVIDRMQATTGLSLEQLKVEHNRRVHESLLAMQSRNVFREVPSSKVEKLDYAATHGTYRLKRYKGKGISEKPVVLLSMDSVALESDDLLWWHVSVSRVDGKMPTYQDVAFVREHVLGNRWCLHYFPPTDQYVNDHQTTLHLWHCLESNPLPDFRKFGTI